jgi:hypothetical protein
LLEEGGVRLEVVHSARLIRERNILKVVGEMSLITIAVSSYRLEQTQKWGKEKMQFSGPEGDRFMVTGELDTLNLWAGIDSEMVMKFADNNKHVNCMEYNTYARYTHGFTCDFGISPNTCRELMILLLGSMLKYLGIIKYYKDAIKYSYLLDVIKDVHYDRMIEDEVSNIYVIKDYDDEANNFISWERVAIYLWRCFYYRGEFAIAQVGGKEERIDLGPYVAPKKAVESMLGLQVVIVKGMARYPIYSASAILKPLIMAKYVDATGVLQANNMSKVVEAFKRNGLDRNFAVDPRKPFGQVVGTVGLNICPME